MAKAQVGGPAKKNPYKRLGYKPELLPKNVAKGWKPPVPEAVSETAYAKLIKGMKVKYAKNAEEVKLLVAQGWKVQKGNRPGPVKK